MLEGVAEREEGVNTFSASLKQPPLTKPSQRYHAITLEIRCHPPKKTLYCDSLVQLSVYSCGASSIYAFSCQIPVTLDVVMVTGDCAVMLLIYRISRGVRYFWCWRQLWWWLWEKPTPLASSSPSTVLWHCLSLLLAQPALGFVVPNDAH